MASVDDDAAFVARLAAGEPAAFGALIDRFGGRLLRLALGFVNERSVAEEVVQDTWVAVVTGLKSFEGRSSFDTWVFRILCNRARTRGAREKRTVPFSSLEVEGEGVFESERFDAKGHWTSPPRRWDEEDPEKLLLRREMLGVLGEAIARLPTTQRVVVTLRDIEGLESGEVCNILDITETNQRVLLHRARARLRAALEEALG
jgi:RNA polymerase sigma-70 factor (ECF subfamily)